MDWIFFSKAPSNQILWLTIGVFFVLLLLRILPFILNPNSLHSQRLLRWTLHLLLGIFSIISPLSFKTSWPLILLLVLSMILDLVLNQRPSGDHQKISGRSYGMTFWALAFLSLIFLFWDSHKPLLILGMSFFAFADLLASVVGQSFSKNHVFVLVKDQKSWLGSASMFVLSWAIFYFGLKHILNFHQHLIGLSFALALVVACVETLSAKGSDNFFVPLSGALLLYLSQHFDSEQIKQLLTGELLAFLTAILSYRFKFLSLSGSFMVFILATLIFGLGGWAWSVPILTFFILSSLLSKMGKQVKQKFKDTFEKSGVRDHAQVLANGGLGGLLILFNAFFPSNLWYYLYLLSLMVATADTWSTEIGVLSKAKPRLITTFKKVEPGISGGVTILGTLGGFLGSLIILFSGFWFIKISFGLALILLLLSLIGNALDSLLGATIQGQYQCTVCYKYTEKKEHCQKPTTILSGFKVIGNDCVNVLSNLITLIFFIVLTLIKF